MPRVGNTFFILVATLALVSLGAAKHALADSKDIMESIKHSLEADTPMGAYDIKVVCRQGQVILHGTVASEHARTRALEIAQETAGVRSVTDWLAVSEHQLYPDSTVRASYAWQKGTLSEAQIAASIHAVIAAEDRTLADKISVSFHDGIATLSGDMKNFREVDKVLATALMAPDVADVSSQLTVRGKAYGAPHSFR